MSRITPPRDNASDQEWRDFMRELNSRLLCDTFTWDPGSISANTVAATTLTAASYPALQGLRTTMVVTVTPPDDLDSGLRLLHCTCATDDTLTIRLENVTGSPIDQGSGTWQYSGRRP